jgi:Trypsin
MKHRQLITILIAQIAAYAGPANAVVGGKEVSELEQNRRGLVAVGGGCSGVMISEDWVLTAGHCVPNTRPAPAITIRASWNGGVSVASDAIYQFADVSDDKNPGAEIALIHLSSRMPGINPGYRLQLYQGSLESLRGQTIAKYGRGLSSYAERNPATGGRVAPEGSGRYRAADLKVQNVSGHKITYLPNESAQALQPGDSGGPGFIWSDGLALLVGITSTAAWDCFDKSGATPQDVDRNCRGSIYRQKEGHDIAIPAVKAAIEAVLKTKWNPNATSEPVWVFRPEIQITTWQLTDVNTATWAQATRAGAKLCHNRGFVAGRFDGHQDVAKGGYGIQCSGRSASWRDASAAEISATPWGFTDVNTVNWAHANRAAERLCAAANQGFAGGHFNGHMDKGRFGLFCYKDSAQWFDAAGADIAATGFGFATARLDDVPWSQASRAATNYCRKKGFSGGFMNGHFVPGKYGVVCQK